MPNYKFQGPQAKTRAARARSLFRLFKCSNDGESQWLTNINGSGGQVKNGNENSGAKFLQNNAFIQRVEISTSYVSSRRVNSVALASVPSLIC